MLCLPFAPYRLSQGFSASHQALDLVPLLTDTLAGAPFAGTVTFAGEDQRPELAQYPQYNRGFYVQIEDYHRMTRLCHLRGDLRVQEGARVETGDDLGIVWYSGYVLPPGPGGLHVHWSLAVGGVFVDPLLYLEEDDVSEPTIIDSLNKAWELLSEIQFHAGQGSFLTDLAEKVKQECIVPIKKNIGLQ